MKCCVSLARGAPPDNDNRTLPPVPSLIWLKTKLRILAPGKCHLCKKLFVENAAQKIFSFNPVPCIRPIMPFRIDSHTAGILILMPYKKAFSPNDDGRFEFFDVALTVAGRCVSQGFDSCIANCPTPENGTEFIDKFKDMCKREETEKEIILV